MHDSPLTPLPAIPLVLITPLPPRGLGKEVKRFNPLEFFPSQRPHCHPQDASIPSFSICFFSLLSVFSQQKQHLKCSADVPRTATTATSVSLNRHLPSLRSATRGAELVKKGSSGCFSGVVAVLCSFERAACCVCCVCVGREKKGRWCSLSAF
jgi:hypothetical protein